MKKSSKLLFAIFAISILLLSSAIIVNSKNLDKSGKGFEVVIKYKDAAKMEQAFEQAMQKGELSGKSAKLAEILDYKDKKNLDKFNKQITKSVTEAEYKQLQNSPDV